MTHDELGRLLKNQTTPEFDAMPPNKKMTVDQITDAIQKAVSCTAENLLERCEPPTKVQNGYSYLIDEHWELCFDDLFVATVAVLYEQGWEIEAGNAIGKQIDRHCKAFLKTKKYDDMVEDIRRGYYETKYEDENPYKSRGLSRNDFI